MKGKKTLLASAVTASVILILVVGLVPIAAKDKVKEPGEWNITVPASSLEAARSQFLMFCDFSAEKMHLSFPLVDPAGYNGIISADIEYIKTTGDYRNNLQVVGKKPRLVFIPGEPPLPFSVQVAADILTVDMFVADEPDPDTGEIGYITAVFEGAVVFRLGIDIDPLPPWILPLPLYDGPKFTVHVTMILPDYEITFDPDPSPDPLVLWSQTPWDPPQQFEADIDVTVTPKTETFDGPVWFGVEVEGVDLDVEYDGSPKVPPFTTTMHIRSKQMCTGGAVTVRLQGMYVPPGIEKKICVVVQGHFDGSVLSVPPDPKPRVELPNDGQDYYLADVIFHLNKEVPVGPTRARFQCGATDPGIEVSLTRLDGTPINWGDLVEFEFDDPNYPLGVFRGKLWFSTTLNPQWHTVRFVAEGLANFEETYIYPLEVEVIEPP